MSKIVRFVRVKETPGTFQYKEVDKDGEEKQSSDCYIGTLYIRKGKIKKCPKNVTIKLILGDED